MRNPKAFAALIAILSFLQSAKGQQPTEPIDITPINGEVYYLINQLSGMEAAAGGLVAQQTPSFSDLSQRWKFNQVTGGSWQIINVGNGLCANALVNNFGTICPLGETCHRTGIRLDESQTIERSSGPTYVTQTPCAPVDTQRWILTPTSNGYYTIANKITGLVIDLDASKTSAGTLLLETALTHTATQSQQWLLRPAYFRGVDNALLEKQESARLAAGLPWWNDAGQQEDVLQIFKIHGVNLIRLRPSSTPPYANVSQSGCSGNACYAETEAQDLDLARRAKNLGLSIELTLLFDGGSSASVPSAWSGDTELTQLQSHLYAYVKAEILTYRQAGVMPDLVAIGNEVDTGFLGSIGSPTGADFGGFASLEIAGIQAIHDAAADASIAPAIPPPLTCIHITPAWDLTQFFTLANQAQVPYDAICQSYYPMFHGPLTSAQAAASNPNQKPIEQEVLVNAANTIGKPIFIIETAEHFEDGFDANDPWYAPPTQATQSQFLTDLNTVLEALPGNLAMGMEYWDASGVNIAKPGGTLYNGDNQPDAIYIWNGLTLFDDSATLLPGIDALGGVK